MQQIQLQLPDSLSLKLDSLLQEFKDLKENLHQQPTEYLTRHEVAALLKVDISSVHNYTKRGTLQAYQTNGRVLYKRSEVEASIIKLNK